MKIVAEYIKKIDIESVVAKAFDADLSDIALLTETEIAEATPVVTGHLKGNIAMRKLGFLDYEVATAVEYAPYVEYGTSRFAPRAMFRRGAAKVEAKGMSLFKRTAKVA